MLNKEELLAKDVAELADIANELGAEFHANDDKETIIYAILDKQAVEGSIAPKRKRTRIAKKSEDHVYSVNGKDGENLDKKKGKVAAEAQPSLFKDEVPQKKQAEPETKPAAKQEEKAAKQEAPAAIDPLAAFPKHRGRKSKAELEAIAAAKKLWKSSRQLHNRLKMKPQKQLPTNRLHKKPTRCPKQPLLPAMPKETNRTTT